MKIPLLIILIVTSMLFSACKGKNSSQPNNSAPISFASPSPSASSENTQSSESLVEAIKSQLARKYTKSITDINLVINQELPEHASGAVNFSGEMGGALWFAAKTKGGWILVADGQGPMDCELSEQYKFPVSMIPACLSGDKVIQRSNQ